ncbi:methylated-DNA--[protein]-cysteine S-methyltransferase [Sphingomonas sp. MAH-20]|uniref:Methylated-DNA--protein-cysteine methyltransferase n=1 Tax=Sphingomonas horti TaxID=2682842 RepID=A0A6I4IXP4_9SPHN|nr:MULTISPECIES: methylated-DNA--[protein]-cysteine S-methyltransferase [Sphingomonas]MBA2920928.1 methylated-DNA--[protein]-cysteine S-methyltransferase [Sphingomonas sp. CGMCC 1.13658]MVO76914.1 methylated-DNA--[protein]-cysteine S-methyltransferase [Sphingomonas horti]
MAYARATATIATPIGPVRIEAEGDALTGIRIGQDGAGDDTPLLREARAQLAAYFEGKLTVFDLPLAPAATAEAKAQRAAIASIGYGETRTYGDLAEACGSSARAMGQACASNPFPVVVPCHRVLPAGGALGYYSAGDGPATKAWLLRHERAEGWLL